MNRSHMILPATGCLLLTAVSTASSARAQYHSVSGVTWNNPASATYDNMLTFARQDFLLESNRKALLASVRGGKTGVAAKPSPLLFKRSVEPLVADSIANAWGETADDKKQLSKAFREGIHAVRTEFAKLAGEPNPDDIAKAFALYVSVNYSVLHPGFNLSDAGGLNLLRQCRAMLEASSGTARATDHDKQVIWETLVIPSIYVLAQNQRAATEKDAKSLQACVTIAGEGLKAVFAVDPARVVLSEGDLPLSILPEVTLLKPDARGEFHQAWMAFPLPAGWKAEQAQGTLLLTPDGVKAGETVKVIVVPDKPGQVRFISGAYNARSLFGAGADFAGEFQTGDLSNGWNYYKQPLKMKPNGAGLLLQVSAPGTQQIVFVITIGSSAEIVNRTSAAFADILAKKGRIAR